MMTCAATTNVQASAVVNVTVRETALDTIDVGSDETNANNANVCKPKIKNKCSFNDAPLTIASTTIDNGGSGRCVKADFKSKKTFIDGINFGYFFLKTI